MRAALTGLLLLAAFAVPAAGSTRATDPPRIVPWHLIGNVGLGMSQARVERLYGRGTVATPPRDELFWDYRGRGAIRVAYDLAGHAASVETTSPAYASRSGIHVGMSLPARLCGFADGKCKHSWHGFTYSAAYSSWERVAGLGRIERAYVELELDPRSVVKRISMTRFMACPAGQYATLYVCRKPPPGAYPQFYYPPPTGLRFCQFPGGPGNFLAASPVVRCALAEDVVEKLWTHCADASPCDADGFHCIAEWSGRYPRSFADTNHAICSDGPRRRVVWDGG